MGATRLRISAFPTVTAKSEIGHAWQPPALPKASKYKASASHCFEGDTVEAIGDGLLPENSKDHSIPRLTWWPHVGSREWVQFDFGSAKKITSAAVYWFDDTGAGSCRAPESWRVLYRESERWKEVTGASGYGTKTDAYNRVTFEPVQTTALRIEARLKPGFSGGILEWKFIEDPNK